MIQIKARCCGAVICEGHTVGMALWVAVRDGISLAHADLHGMELARLQIPGADLRGANLEHADFFGANLEGANLTGAMVTGAYFKDANLARVNYTHTVLYGYTNLVGANMDGAFCDGPSEPVPVPSDEIITRYHYDQERQVSVYSLWYRGVLVYSGPDEDVLDQLRTSFI